MPQKIKFIDEGRVELEAALDLGKPGLNAELDVLTDGDMTGTANGAMEVVGATNSGDVSGAIMNNFKELQTKLNYLLLGRNPAWEVYGTNMTTALAAFDAQGGLKLTTAGADNDQAALQTQANSGNSLFRTAGLFGSENEPEFEALIKTGSSIADAKILMGLSLTTALDLTTDNDGIKLHYDPEVGTRWRLCWSIGGSDYAYTVPNDVLGVVAADTLYRLKVRIYADRSFMGFINEKPVAANPFPVLADAKDLHPFVGLQALTGAAKHFYVLGRPRLSRKAS